MQWRRRRPAIDQVIDIVVAEAGLGISFAQVGQGVAASVDGKAGIVRQRQGAFHERATGQWTAEVEVNPHNALGIGPSNLSTG
jgi:hypothetical protein